MPFGRIIYIIVTIFKLPILYCHIVHCTNDFPTEFKCMTLYHYVVQCILSSLHNFLSEMIQFISSSCTSGGSDKI